MRLLRFETFSTKLTTLSGLKIGGNKDTLGIGETDNPVIRDPLTRLPYIPGSSIKGKTRSLLEGLHRWDRKNPNTPCDCGKCSVCLLYGCGTPSNSLSPARLIFRDATLSHESKLELERTLPGSFVEVKMETRIDRVKNSAARGSLRDHERVPSQIDFEFDLVLRVFKEDEERLKNFYKCLADAFKMLEEDYLGGNGSRGYGKVKVIAEDGITHFHKFLRDKAAALS